MLVLARVSEPLFGIAELAPADSLLLSQLGVYLAEDFVDRLEPFGVEPRTYAVLKALIEDDGRSQRQLSARAWASTATRWSPVVGKLERGGWSAAAASGRTGAAFAVTTHR